MLKRIEYMKDIVRLRSKIGRVVEEDVRSERAFANRYVSDAAFGVKAKKFRTIRPRKLAMAAALLYRGVPPYSPWHRTAFPGPTSVRAQLP